MDVVTVNQHAKAPRSSKETTFRRSAEAAPGLYMAVDPAFVNHVYYYRGDGEPLGGAAGDVLASGVARPRGHSLERLQILMGYPTLDFETIYPAHGPVIGNGKQKIREYMAHRELRERQVLNALADGPLEVIAIVKKIYTDVPEFLCSRPVGAITSEEAAQRWTRDPR